MVNKEVRHRKHPITEIGRTVPANFKFGIIVAIVVIWVQFFRLLLEKILSFMGITGQIVADFLIAVIVTFLGYLVLLSYRKIRFRMKKIKI
jgi:hypothetical protein